MFLYDVTEGLGLQGPQVVAIRVPCWKGRGCLQDPRPGSKNKASSQLCQRKGPQRGSPETKSSA